LFTPNIAYFQALFRPPFFSLSLILELGIGFAFMGEEYRLQVGDDDFYVHLLFYH
jgi:hypothetical protein